MLHALVNSGMTMALRIKPPVIQHGPKKIQKAYHRLTCGGCEITVQTMNPACFGCQGNSHMQQVERTNIINLLHTRPRFDAGAISSSEIARSPSSDVQ